MGWSHNCHISTRGLINHIIPPELACNMHTEKKNATINILSNYESTE